MDQNILGKVKTNLAFWFFLQNFWFFLLNCCICFRRFLTDSYDFNLGFFSGITESNGSKNCLILNQFQCIMFSLKDV